MGATFKSTGNTRRGQSASIGELLGGVRVKTTRSFQPVRRNSYAANDQRVLAVWQPLGKPHEARKIAYFTLKAAEEFERRHKRFGKQNGPLGHIGLEVLRYLYRTVDYRTGRLDPAIGTMCSELVRSREPVNKALGRLVDHGFLVSMRRAEPTNCPGAGPQIRQMTNAYGLRLPKPLAEWIARRWSDAPVPDCDLTRRKAEQDEFEAMLDQLSVEDQMAATIGNDGPLADAIVALARAYDRNSASSANGQNPPKSL
jgi:hypothetical protein